MKHTQLAARLEGVIDRHVDAIAKLGEHVLDPQLDPLEACRHADAMCYVLRAASTMLEELYRQLAQQSKQSTKRAH